MCADSPTHVIAPELIRSILIVTKVSKAAGKLTNSFSPIRVNNLLTLSITGLGFVKSLTGGANGLTILHGAVLFRLHAAVMLGVRVVNYIVTTHAIRFLLCATVSTPVPTFIMRALGWVASGVTSSVSLDSVWFIRTAIECAIIRSFRFRVVFT